MHRVTALFLLWVGTTTETRPFPAGLVVIATVFDPIIPLPAGPVTFIVTVIWAFGNEWVIFAVRSSDAPLVTVDGVALMLTELVRPTEEESLMPIANREPFALRAAATAMMSNTITVTDARSHLPSLLCPGETTEPINLVILGANARILPRKDNCYRKTSTILDDVSLKSSRSFTWLRIAIRATALPQT